MVAVCGAASAASAGDGAPAPAGGAKRAVDYFDEGTKLYEEARWAEAEVAFQKAWDLQQTHDIAANLGDCELHVGQAREAAEHLAFAVSTFPMTGNDAVLKRLVERFEEAKREVATVRVTVNVDGATILAGGRRVGQSPLLREVFVEPGTIQLEVRLAGYQPFARAVAAKKGSAEEIDVALAPAGGSGPAPARRSMVPVFVGLGVAAAAVGTGIAFVALSNGASSDADDQGAALDRMGAECPNATHAAQCEELGSSLERLDTFGNGAIVAFVLGGAALAGTGAYFFWSEPKREASAAVRVRPMVGREGGGLLLVGSF
jgi:hypothetical protein